MPLYLTNLEPISVSKVIQLRAVKLGMKENETGHWAKIKEGILKSGLPLELEVRNLIDSISNKFRLTNHGEYFFELKEGELPSSVDFKIVSDAVDLGQDFDFVQIHFLIECKYRTRNTRWFFVPEPTMDSGDEFFIENIAFKGKIRWENFSGHADLLGKNFLVGKGVEMAGNGRRYSEGIRDGFYQLSFAAASHLGTFSITPVPSLIKTYQKSRGINLKNRSFHALVCPMLVTNAEILALKNIGISEIERSGKVEEVAERHDVLLHRSHPSPQIQRYITQSVLKRALESLPSIGLPDFPKERVESNVWKLVTFYPSRFYVVKVGALPVFIEDYIAFIRKLTEFAHEQAKKIS